MRQSEPEVLLSINSTTDFRRFSMDMTRLVKSSFRATLMWPLCGAIIEVGRYRYGRYRYRYRYLDYSPLWATHNHYRQQVVDDVNIIP